MISVIFCSRVKGNDDSSLKRLLDSTVEFTTPTERREIEFLIKFDDDDDARPSDSFFAQYPFPIRTFVWSRGEGRHSLHHAQEYLFTQRDPRSRFLLMTADDFYFTRPNFVSEILATPDEFCILGYIRPPIESFKGIYEQDAAIRRWAVSFGSLSPVVSTRLIEVCQNFGWQANVDGWLMGLSVVLYDLYGIVLWKTHEPFYQRGGGYGLGDTPTYNNMELTGQKGPFNKYWFELLRRQARNLYLNIVHGTDLHRRTWNESLFLFWRKVRSQPLHQLPRRICRKLYHTLGNPCPPAEVVPAVDSNHFNPWGYAAEWRDGVPPESTVEDLKVLNELLREVRRRNMVVVEIGSWVGNGSTRAIVEAIRPIDGILHCVDTWAGSDNVPHHQEYRRRYGNLFSVFADNVRKYGGQSIVRPLRMESLEAARLFRDESIDLVFIDGHHGYSHVREDILAWLPKVKRGGILCGHDCDANFPKLHPELQSEIGMHCEEDIVHNDRYPGPPVLHGGVVKAVHDVLGDKVRLWHECRPTTLWSYTKRSNVMERFLTWFQNVPSVGKQVATAQSPWPAVEADTCTVGSEKEVLVADRCD